MCGRTCLTLAPNEIQCACKYKQSDKNNKEKEKTPEWRSELNLGKKYIPSYNIAPSEITPVLVSAAHFDGNQTDRVLVPMMWGMIPFWHKGEYNKHGLTTNNCRLEHLMESRLYKQAFKKGQRCVVVCEGFYEWQTTKSAKPSERPAYYIYMPQKHEIKIEDKSSWNMENINFLKMAGLFDIWTDANGDTIYSYTVITFDSNEKLSWMHSRMPAVLDSDEQVADWLDFKRVPMENALKLLTPATHLVWHRVSNIVNNSRNKSAQCNKIYSEESSSGAIDDKKTVKSKMMQSWLIKKKSKKGSDEDEKVPSKKMKIEKT